MGNIKPQITLPGVTTNNATRSKVDFGWVGTLSWIVVIVAIIYFIIYAIVDLSGH